MGVTEGTRSPRYIAVVDLRFPDARKYQIQTKSKISSVCLPDFSYSDTALTTELYHTYQSVYYIGSLCMVSYSEEFTR